MAAGMTWQYLRGELSVRLEQLEATSGQTAACEVARLRAEVAAGPVRGWPWPVRGRLTFPNGAPHPLPPYGELTEPQQRVVRTLAGLGPTPGAGPTSSRSCGPGTCRAHRPNAGPTRVSTRRKGGVPDELQISLLCARARRETPPPSGVQIGGYLPVRALVF